MRKICSPPQFLALVLVSLCTSTTALLSSQDGLPSLRHPLRVHFATHSGLKCLHFPKTLEPPHSVSGKHTPAQASTRRKAAKPEPGVVEATLEEDRPARSFWEKLVAAFEIFFPPAQVQEAPRQRAKQRLRMILVADRCSVSPTSVSQIKKAIVESLSNFVEIEQALNEGILRHVVHKATGESGSCKLWPLVSGKNNGLNTFFALSEGSRLTAQSPKTEEDKVDLNITTDPNLGTIYSVSVPVRRVKPEFDIQTEYENKEFYFDSDGEQIRSFNLSFEDMQPDVVGSKDGASVPAPKVPDTAQRRRGPVLPDAPLVDGRGPPDGPT